jgi:hypothetical protein
VRACARAVRIGTRRASCADFPPRGWYSYAPRRDPIHALIAGNRKRLGVEGEKWSAESSRISVCRPNRPALAAAPGAARGVAALQAAPTDCGQAERADRAATGFARVRRVIIGALLVAACTLGAARRRNAGTRRVADPPAAPLPAADALRTISLPPGWSGRQFDVLRARLAVVIGAGVRLPPGRLVLFEALVNAIHRAAPGAAVAFNTARKTRAPWRLAGSDRRQSWRATVMAHGARRSSWSSTGCTGIAEERFWLLPEGMGTGHARPVAGECGPA